MNSVVSKSTYIKVWLTLMLLLFLTWGTAQFDLGVANMIVALAVAMLKALLIILFFMQVRYQSRLTWLFAGMGFFWLLIIIVLTLTDYLSRSHVAAPYDRQSTGLPASHVSARATVSFSGISHFFRLSDR